LQGAGTDSGDARELLVLVYGKYAEELRPRALLAVGRGALLVVPAEEVGGAEGLVALSMAAGDLAGLGQALGRAGIAALRSPGGLTLEPAHTHGVPLQVSRFE
jgi:hypothetical protein